MVYFINERLRNYRTTNCAYTFLETCSAKIRFSILISNMVAENWLSFIFTTIENVWFINCVAIGYRNIRFTPVVGASYTWPLSLSYLFQIFTNILERNLEYLESVFLNLELYTFLGKYNFVIKNKTIKKCKS